MRLTPTPLRCYTQSVEEIESKVHQRTQDAPAANIRPFVEKILQRYGNRVVGIFMYGSVLSKVTAAADSFPDFFVITDGYRRVFQRMSHWILAYPLPPHIYHLRINEQLHCKYNLVSFGRFRRECSKRAKDIYILGRFGKRVSLVYARDEDARKKLLNCCFSAMMNVVPWTLRGMDRTFDETEFALACLNISYAGETRVEASSKVPKLFEAEKSLYMDVYPNLLEQHPKAGKLVKKTEDGRFVPAGGKFVRWLRRLRLKWFLKRSRIRGILRWPKFLVTVDEWIDIILAKIERTKGIKIIPSPRARRHPLIFAWPHFFRLIKAGALGSSKKPPDRKSLKK
jgi:hypothetical protein